MIAARPEQMPQEQEASIGTLFSQLAAETNNLIRQEFRLAVAETRQNVKRGARAGAWLAAGVGMALVGGLVLVAALILLLALWLPAWIASAIVGIVLGGIGAVVANQGLTKLERAEITPDDTIASVKESTEWLKDQIKN